MSKYLVCIIICIVSIGTSCCLIQYDALSGFVRIVRDTSCNSLVLYRENISKADVQEYGNCVKYAYFKFSNKVYLSEQKDSSPQLDFKFFYMIVNHSYYIGTYEMASPYNYDKFVSRIIEHLTQNPDPTSLGVHFPYEQTMQFMQDLAHIQYEQCGENVYTIAERCAALSAVNIYPSWCSAVGK